MVTGASRGLGRAMAARLVQEGIEVLGVTRDPSTVEPLPGVTWISLDLASPEDVDAALGEASTRFGDIDLLVHCAGFADAGRLDDFSSTSVRAQFEVMLASPVRLTQAVLPGMRRRGYGAIVNVASLAVELPIPFLSIYDSAKAGLAGFSRALMLELSGSGVNVIDFRPGDFKTDFFAASKCFSASDRDVAIAWDRMRKQVESGPLPHRAADAFWNALQRGDHRTVRTGAWFQAGLAAWAARQMPASWMRCWIRRYYGLKGS